MADARWTTRLARFGYWEDDGPEIAWVDGPAGDNDCQARGEAAIRELEARAVAAETALAAAHNVIRGLWFAGDQGYKPRTAAEADVIREALDEGQFITRDEWSARPPRRRLNTTLLDVPDQPNPTRFMQSVYPHQGPGTVALGDLPDPTTDAEDDAAPDLTGPLADLVEEALAYTERLRLDGDADLKGITRAAAEVRRLRAAHHHKDPQ